MNASRRKRKPAAKASPWRRGALALVLLAVLGGAAVFLTERRDWPAALRDHDAVAALYRARDKTAEALRPAGELLRAPVKKDAKAPINTRPAVKKPEQGYSAQDRARLDALIEKEGEQP